MSVTFFASAKSIWCLFLIEIALFYKVIRKKVVPLAYPEEDTIKSTEALQEIKDYFDKTRGIAENEYRYNIYLVFNNALSWDN